MASGSMGSLTIDLLMETAQWITGLNAAEHKAMKFADAIEKKFDKMADSAIASLKKMAAGAIAGFAVDRIIGFIDQTQKAADTLGELSERTATSIGFLAQMSIIAEKSGSSLEGITGAMDKFNKSVATASNDPNSSAAKIFKALKIELLDGNGVIKTTEQLYKEFMMAMGKMAESAYKVAGAQKILGKSGAEQIPVMNAYARQTDEVRAAEEAYGRVMDDLAPIAGALEEQQSLLHITQKETAAVLGEQLIPYYTKLLQQWNEGATKAGSLGQVATFLLNVFKVLVLVVDGLITGLRMVWAAFWGGAKLFEALTVFRSMDKAREVIKDYTAELTELGEQGKERWHSLVVPWDQTTAAINQATNASEEFKKSVTDPPKVPRWRVPADIKNAMGDKLKVPKLEMDLNSYETFRLNLQRTYDQVDQLTHDLTAKFGSAFNTIEGLAMDTFSTIFDFTKEGWEGLLDKMKSGFKSILMDFVRQQFVKPLVLNLLAQAPGGIGQLASTQLMNLPDKGGWVSEIFKGGSGDIGSNIMGKFGEWFSKGDSLTSSAGWGPGWTAAAGVGGALVGRYGAAALGAGQRGQQVGAQWASTLGTIGMMTPLGPLGAAIGIAIGTAIGKFSDPDPDAMRAAVFGGLGGAEGVTPWTGKSAFGSFGFSQGEWLSEADMGPALKGVIDGITNMDNAIAKFMSPEQIEDIKQRLEAASKRYELGMEHTGVEGLKALLKDRIAVIARVFNESLGKFVDTFEGTTEELATIVGAYIQVRSAATDFDPMALAAESQPLSQVADWEKQRTGLLDFMAEMDTSAESMTELTTRMADFQLASVQMVAAIDAIIASIHEMFATTAEQIRLDTMNSQEQYAYWQAQADADYAALLASNDPAEIERLATRINQAYNNSWGLLDEGQKEILGPEFLRRLALVDQTVADRLTALQGDIVTDSGSVMETVITRLDTLFTAADAAASTQLTAANTQLEAANTPHQVFVVGGDGGLVMGT